MKIDLEQVYTLNFTMRLRADPLENKRFLKWSFLIIFFLNLGQQVLLEDVSGNFGSPKITSSMLAVAIASYFLLSPKNLTVKYQATQYLLSAFCLQGVIFTLAKLFYTSFFYVLQNEITLDMRILYFANVIFLTIWLIIFMLSCFYFKKRLLRGDFREGSMTQKKRSNNDGLNLSIKSLIFIIVFSCLLLVMRIVGEDINNILLAVILLIMMFITLGGIMLFPEYLLTAYCKYKFPEFFVEVYGKIEEEGLYFEHCLTYQTRSKLDYWHFPLEDLEEIVIKNNINQTGPVFFFIKKPFKKKTYYEFKYYLPTNQKVELNNDLFGYESIEVADALKTRDTNNVDLKYMRKRMKHYARERKWKIKVDELYGVILNNSDEVIFDFYIPLIKTINQRKKF
ncbi:hypothetical protein [Listeria immobilis]|uniref:hypothetical protein n=1 Tax=Listeria immobilis TaxID=2713502 RepID=UPI0021AB51AE|nr:hypothetical protein [Listeria immobilis]